VAESPTKPASGVEGLSLSRWSRLKRQQRVGSPSVATGETLAEGAVQASTPPPAQTPTLQPTAPDPNGSVALPPLSKISLTEDFTPFMQAKVPQLLKQQALKALFKDPHFNAMDGLDTYIDDYTVFEPITAEEMSKLSAWQSIQKPLKQVVTPSGYAVDVESEEGMAVLAERERLEALGSEPSGTTGTETASEAAEFDADVRTTETAAREPERVHQGADEGPIDEPPRPADFSTRLHRRSNPLPRAGAAAIATDATAPPVAAPTSLHPRYGKRVSDFTFIEVAPEMQDIAPDATSTQIVEKP
jgi:hypothetical protein